MTPKVVIGKRLPFWKGMTPGEVLYILASPVFLVLAVRWFLGLRHVQGGLFSDDNFGGTVMGGLFAIAGLIAGGYGIWMLLFAKHTGVIVSACPSCGVERKRSFADANRKDDYPAPCGACLTYLRVKGLEVSEESIDAFDTMKSCCQLQPETYVPIVKRDPQGRFLFAIPAMCAVCCSSDAALLRDIGEWGRTNNDIGILGTIVSAAASEVAADAGVSYANRPQHNAPSTSVSALEQLDLGLRQLKTPVCDKHTEMKDHLGNGNALAYWHGTLTFASYRYYRAFCELNQLTAAKPPAAQ